jgi:hypothetical protein
VEEGRFGQPDFGKMLAASVGRGGRFGRFGYQYPPGVFGATRLDSVGLSVDFAFVPQPIKGKLASGAALQAGLEWLPKQVFLFAFISLSALLLDVVVT